MQPVASLFVRTGAKGCFGSARHTNLPQHLVVLYEYALGRLNNECVREYSAITLEQRASSVSLTDTQRKEQQ
jgi:hypothetical protein